ncbi:DUF1349 domain-containing protein [Haloprofundus salilacus]|uniref:DUF1349 domain-containing protein n=1 Tax=Haloprofundus salilacus TaxID=2876190 RepID=UPI001CC98F5D|nr:DUF1349 domain-containing protein [Haloprofundus salilacus]
MSHDRRKFLRVLGVGSVGALAGCPSKNAVDADSSSGSNETEDSSNDGDSAAPKVITVNGAGADIWNSSDLGHFYYAQVSSDFDVSVQVTSIENTNPHAKAGLMVRESLEPDSRNVMARRRAGFALSPQWRPEDSASTTSTTSEDGSDLSRVEGGTMEGSWLRLQRVGDTVRAYGSEDGENWTLMVELTASQIDLSSEVYVGLAVTSHDQAQAASARFRNLSGIELEENGDIGKPIVPGSVDVSQSAVLTAVEPADTTATSATLRANLEALGQAESVDVRFDYREVTADEWQQTEAKTLPETGEFGIDVSGLTGRRYYEFRAVADDGENEISTVNDLFSTPSGSSGGSGDGPRSSSQFDPDDGFAEMAPWLDDDTPLVIVSEPTREALETATNVDGPRVVVFETSGVIDLEAQDLNLRNSQCWIAGQTAPSPGITLIRGGLWVYGNDCVVQHIRVRPGDAGQETGWQPDGIEIADDTRNNVVDHCTGTWGVDENINAGYDTENSTISNCLVAEPLNDATHPKGTHGYNTIIGNRAKNVTLAGNVWAHATDRNPRLKQGSEAVVVNNFIHYYHDGMWADPDTSHSIVGNVFEKPQTDQPNIFGEGSVYVEDNVPDPDADVPMVGEGISELDSRPLWPEALSAISSADVKEHNLTNAGARPADRTEHDERIVENIRNGGGGVIDSQDDVGGYPSLAENSEPLDEPESGLRAWLRERALAVEQ